MAPLTLSFAESDLVAFEQELRLRHALEEKRVAAEEESRQHLKIQQAEVHAKLEELWAQWELEQAEDLRALRSDLCAGRIATDILSICDADESWPAREVTQEVLQLTARAVEMDFREHPVVTRRSAASGASCPRGRELDDQEPTTADPPRKLAEHEGRPPKSAEVTWETCLRLAANWGITSTMTRQYALRRAELLDRVFPGYATGPAYLLCHEPVGLAQFRSAACNNAPPPRLPRPQVASVLPRFTERTARRVIRSQPSTLRQHLDWLSLQATTPPLETEDPRKRKDTRRPKQGRGV